MTIDFTPEQIEEFELYFNTFDKNGDKKITFEEFCKAMRKVGFNESDEKLKEMFLQADLNGDGEIDSNEFLESIKQSIESEKNNTGGLTTEQDYRKTFESIDTDGDGYITRNELKSFMEINGETRSCEEMDTLMKEGDVDGDENIDFVEFCQLVKTS